MIHSPALAKEIRSVFDNRIASHAYEVRLSDGKLYWLEYRDGQWLRHDTEPGTTFYRRAGVCFLSILPIEWLL